MADITSSSTPEGAKQESADAQTLDELTSLQQQNPAGLAAETTDVTVTTGDPTKQDDPSLVTASTVQYGAAALPEGSAPSPTTIAPLGANVPTTEQVTALNQNVQTVAAEQLATPTPMDLGTATAELAGVPATPERLDQTAPFVPTGFADPSEVVVIQEDQTVISNLLAGTTSPDGMVYYFFPQPDSSYIFNALACAMEVKKEIRRISERWRIKKDWLNDLFLNTAVHEGQEWLGTFQTSTSIEFAVLGNTINQAARVSDFARHGSIWATKDLMSKLSTEERDKIDFGVSRQLEDRQHFVPSSYAQIESLVDLKSGRYEKLKDISTLAITEIRSIQTTR